MHGVTQRLTRAYSSHLLTPLPVSPSHAMTIMQCVVCDDLRRYLLLPGPLACKYTAYVFLTFHKFEFKRYVSKT